ncbi:homoserine O-acetyltransferase/O-succinyltransferase family protein [Escherichia coli]
MEAGLGPEVPYNYFPHYDSQNTPRASWRSHGNLLFTNWLNYYVYQITPDTIYGT